MTSLVLSAELRADLERRVLAGLPFETCGSLLGRRTTSRVEVVSVEQGRSLRESGEHFELDPAHLVQAEATARERNLEIVGIWHSHPQQPAVPSEADREHAWREWSYLIASVDARGEIELRSWRLEGESFREELIEG